MTDDQLYQYFKDRDMKEYKEKNGLSENIIKNDKEIKKFKFDVKGEENTCLICREDFEKL